MESQKAKTARKLAMRRAAQKYLDAEAHAKKHEPLPVYDRTRSRKARVGDWLLVPESSRVLGYVHKVHGGKGRWAGYISYVAFMSGGEWKVRKRSGELIERGVVLALTVPPGWETADGRVIEPVPVELPEPAPKKKRRKLKKVSARRDKSHWPGAPAKPAGWPC